jgi:hypothetical protein
MPEQSGPILARADAEDVLGERLLECLRESGHRSMIVRIGQGYDAREQGPLAPLKIVFDKAFVDYYDIDDFSGTKLGRCVSEAALGVRTRAFRGDYMHFDLVNDAVPDPLAGASKYIDRKEAETALSALDEEARECALRHPRFAEPGKTLNFNIGFRGADGAVTRVLPFYVDDSPYRACLEKTYGQARVSPFRRLEEKVMHKLSP